MDYAIVEISGRQYLVKPGQTLEVDKLPEEQKALSVDKVLLLSENHKIEVGTPYVKKTLDFEIMGSIKKPKVRVAVYKPKANYRRVTGQRREVTRIKLVEKSVKKD